MVEIHRNCSITRREHELRTMRRRNLWTILMAVVGALLVSSPLVCWLCRPLLMAAAGSSEADYQAGKPVTHMVYWRTMQSCIILASAGMLLLSVSRYLWHRRHREAALLDPAEP
jgi:hypothetical protein